MLNKCHLLECSTFLEVGPHSFNFFFIHSAVYLTSSLMLVDRSWFNNDMSLSVKLLGVRKKATYMYKGCKVMISTVIFLLFLIKGHALNNLIRCSAVLKWSTQKERLAK